MIETNIQVRLDKFDGPLGLLLHLIQREEMSIKELDINKITLQYLDYLELVWINPFLFRVFNVFIFFYFPDA